MEVTSVPSSAAPATACAGKPRTATANGAIMAAPPTP
jgi:hypothetical protein